MRYICTRCKSTSVDGNLWCQEMDCPAGTLPLILQYGDMLGNIKIIKLVCVLRTATIYQAEREGKPILLKVANPGADNENALHEEADALYALIDPRYKHPGIPTWLPHGAVDTKRTYGMVEFQGQMRHYIVMAWVDGDLLTGVLLDNPQMWHVHVGWFLLSLTEAIIRLHQGRGVLHLNLTPDKILVVRNGLGVPQPLLLDLGLLHPLTAPPIDVKRGEAMRALMQPSYTAPELIKGGALTPCTEVYGIGLIGYEMLEGKPAFPQQLRKSEDVTKAILGAPGTQRPKLERDDLPTQPIPKARWREAHITGKDVLPLRDVMSYTLMIKPEDRFYQDVRQFRHAIYAIYGDVQDKRRTDWRRVLRNGAIGLAVIATALMVLSILIPLVVSLTQG